VEKYKVTLTVEERHALDRMVSSGKAAARKLVHARILLLGDEGPAGPRCTDRRSSRPWMSASRPSVACGGVS